MVRDPHNCNEIGEQYLLSTGTGTTVPYNMVIYHIVEQGQLHQTVPVNSYRPMDNNKTPLKCSGSYLTNLR